MSRARRAVKVVMGLALLIGGVRAGRVALQAAAPPPSEEALARVQRVTILRDRYGVPHVVGETDADAAFGLAYAHAEDDFPTIQAVLAAARGQLGLVHPSSDAVLNDYYVALVKVREHVDAQWPELQPATRAVLDGYADGLNVYAFHHPDEVDARLLPFRGRDIAAGFAHKLPYMVGFVDVLKQVSSGELHAIGDRTAALAPRREGREPAFPGSNAQAVHRSRSTDDVTRLNVNSHQPWEGPVAWYEAHIRSGEGWNAMGGLFPGAPMVLHGHNDQLGWALTVNAPDLIDVFRLEMNPSGALEYRLDGAWVPLEVRRAPLALDLWLFDLPFGKDVYGSAHGPVLETDQGFFAIRFSGVEGLVSASEQWLRMNKARTFAEWNSAMEMLAVPMFNIVYADRDTIAYVYNARLPDRAEGFDYRSVLPGDASAPIWRDYLAFDRLPSVTNPPSGFLQACNSTPFSATAGAGNPRPADYPLTASIETFETNRAQRSLSLLGGSEKISRPAFLAMKWDRRFAAESEERQALSKLAATHEPRTQGEARGIELLRGWEGGTEEADPAASVAILTLRPLFYTVTDVDGVATQTKDPVVAFREAVQWLEHHFGRVDVPLGQLQRLRRGSVDLPLGGGPDIMNATYAKKLAGRLVGIQGDSYVMIVDFTAEGPRSESVHVFGSSSRPGSAHFADQSPLFAARRLKDTCFREADLRAHLEREYRPGLAR